MIGNTSSSSTNPPTRMIGTMSPLTTDQPAGMIGTISPSAFILSTRMISTISPPTEIMVEVVNLRILEVAQGLNKAAKLLRGLLPRER